VCTASPEAARCNGAIQRFFLPSLHPSAGGRW
jgi:hypothetical protein